MVFRKIRLSRGRSGFAQGPLIAKELTWLKMRGFLRKRKSATWETECHRKSCLPTPSALAPGDNSEKLTIGLQSGAFARVSPVSLPRSQIRASYAFHASSPCASFPAKQK
jgi:hypothetical protein